jgi:hypothetical protein
MDNWTYPLFHARVGRSVPVRAVGLFLHGSRLDSRLAGLQLYRLAGRFLGKDREEGMRNSIKTPLSHVRERGAGARAVAGDFVCLVIVLK